MNAQTKPKKPLKPYIKFTGIAFQMGATIFIGVLIGQYLDKKYPNKNQIYTIIFTLLFVLLSLYAIVKKIIIEQKKK